MIKKVAICFIFFSIAFPLQGQDTFEKRLANIEMQLNVMSDSLVTGLNDNVDYSVSGIQLSTLLRSIAETHQLNISIASNLDITVSNNFNDVKVKDLLLFLCREYYLEVRFVGSILSIVRSTIPKSYISDTLKITIHPNDQLTINLKRDSLSLFVSQLTGMTDKNVVVKPELIDKLVTGYIKETAFEDVLEKLAYINNIKLNKTPDGFFIFEENDKPKESDLTITNAQTGRRGSSRSSGGSFKISTSFEKADTLISLDAFNSSVTEIIKEVSGRLKKNFIFFSEPTDLTTGHIAGVSFDNLIAYLLQSGDFTFRKEREVYIIGERNEEGLRQVEFIPLKSRTITDIEKFIPKNIIDKVELTIYPDLNGIILSGSAPQIAEIRSFIDLIDKPVPTIHIEVIVIETRKGYSLQTGLKAFLSDSVPNTGGQILGGIDLTLSSKSINNVLDQLNQNNIVNIGKVTPQFYAKLEALETNNNIDIKQTPSLSTLNGYRATLTIGEKEYFILETQNITPGVNPIQTVAKQLIDVEANLFIDILPIVSSDGTITLDIEALFASFTEPRNTDLPPGNTKREFKSKISVRNGEMLLMGGLEEDRKSETGSGVPFLSRIPILKWLFSSKGKEKNDSKLLVFIKPVVQYDY